MSTDRWPEIPEGEMERVFRQLAAEILADAGVDTIQGVPHLLRLVPKNKAEIGSEESRSAELFFNWLLTRPLG
jgi:hypothetical protein